MNDEERRTTGTAHHSDGEIKPMGAPLTDWWNQDATRLQKIAAAVFIVLYIAGLVAVSIWIYNGG